MYTENTSIGELLELPQVMALLEKAAPQMVSGPAPPYTCTVKSRTTGIRTTCRCHTRAGKWSGRGSDAFGSK